MWDLKEPRTLLFVKSRRITDGMFHLHTPPNDGRVLAV